MHLSRIASLAKLDPRIFDALHAIRDRKWSYVHGSPAHSHILQDLSHDLGHPTAWGDPAILPAYGGAQANAIWKKLGVKNRPDVGGFPCEVVHGDLAAQWGLGVKCTTNAALRFGVAFMQALALYLPVGVAEIFLNAVPFKHLSHRFTSFPCF